MGGLGHYDILEQRGHSDHRFLMEMRKESQRLQTFFDFPNLDSETIEDMAETGFFYTGRDDIVKCAFCKGSLRDWCLGDNPKEEHQNNFPDCDFVLGLDVGNVPLLITSNQTVSGQPLCQASEVNPEERQSVDYSSPAVRLATFADWPETNPQSKDDLVDAGFHYLGVGDQVQCFHCLGKLHQWRATDDPLEEHAKYYPHCFLAQQLMKSRYLSPNETGSRNNQRTEVREEDLCSVCMDNRKDCLFLPCHHVACCSECALRLPYCPLCRVPVTDTIRCILP